MIDVHGFLGRQSTYWTEATTRTHKITKPLIWLGTFLAMIGGALFYRNETQSMIPQIQLAIAIAMVLNGLYLSFRVSPYLLEREKQGVAATLLPAPWQRVIAASLILSDIGWWSALALTVIYLAG